MFGLLNHKFRTWEKVEQKQNVVLSMLILFLSLDIKLNNAKINNHMLLNQVLTLPIILLPHSEEMSYQLF